MIAQFLLHLCALFDEVLLGHRVSCCFGSQIGEVGLIDHRVVSDEFDWLGASESRILLESLSELP